MNVLLIKLGALGDMIMATPLIGQIQKHHEHEELWLLTTPMFYKLFENWSGLNVKTFNRKGIKSALQTVRWVRSSGFIRLYDLQSNDHTGIICALSNVPERVGNHPRFPYNIHPFENYHGQCHIYERMLEVLTNAGVKAQHSPPCLPVTDSVKAKVANWLTQYKIEDQKFIIIHAGASAKHPEKRWPYYQHLARTLVDSAYQIVWTGTKSDAELNAQLASVTGIDATDEFSIIELAELGRHARCAITNDSGPMHVLSCSGIPVYAFFGPTNWRRNHAIGQSQNVIIADDQHIMKFRPVSLDRITPDLAINYLRAVALI